MLSKGLSQFSISVSHKKHLEIKLLLRYPLIVQLENHLEADSQKHLATLLRNILADLLFVNGKKMPEGDETCPEQYKGKILLKVIKINYQAH